MRNAALQKRYLLPKLAIAYIRLNRVIRRFRGSIMAVLDSVSSTGPSLFSRIGGALSNALESYAAARMRTAEFEYYNNLSDAELADKGLRREEIAQHIFRDLYI